MGKPIRKLVSLAILLAPLIPAARAQETTTIGAESVVEFILSCRKPNGAFGPIDQEYTDAAWNYPAVAALKLLGGKTDRSEAIFESGLGYPDGHVGYGHWHFYHVHKIRELLGISLNPEIRKVRLVHQGYDEVRYYGSPFGTGGDTFFNAGGDASLDPRDSAAEELGYYNLSSLYYLLAGLKASGRGPADPGALADFVRTRQADSGGFVDIRADGDEPVNEHTHIAHTFQALAILKMLGIAAPNPESTAQFIHSCQNPSGGYLWHPNVKKSGNVADIYYSWAAVKALDLLDREPANQSACRAWINRLHNADGGFGDQPDWRSRLYSTWYAVDTLMTMNGGNVSGAIEQKQRNVPVVEPTPAGQYQIYQALFKVPLVDAEDLPELHERGFNLLALKSDDFAVAESLRAAIRERDLPMDVVLCTEAYPHRARRHGGALLHHICNPILDPGWTPERRSRWMAADTTGAKGLEWKDYQQQVIRSLRGLDSLVYPEQDFEMEYAYSAYDSGLAGVDGYNAILAGFNWAPRDFVRVFPWRERYVDKLIPIADCDAHGDLEKWSPQLDHTRNLFIAKGPGYRDFQEAAGNGRVVCVIRNTGKNGPPAAFYGRPAAVAYVKERVEEWKWWK